MKTNIQLPPVVDLGKMPAQAVVVIMQALGEYGPHKLVHPVLQLVEQKLLAQQVQTPEPAPEPEIVADAPKLISADQ